ncbi:MAG: adenylate/guanylate cyclase domain-containing protein [Actinobacteria bacterium]|nr:MAG: adenylate/guanylate cyclase domain-containing protein [Actinomycetota bacterium]
MAADEGGAGGGGGGAGQPADAPAPAAPAGRTRARTQRVFGGGGAANLRRSVFVAVGLVATLVGVGAYELAALRDPELGTVDARFSLRGAQPKPRDVAVVAIDTNTFLPPPTGLGVRWPFPRSMHARAIDQILRDHPAAIAYDVQFTEQSTPAQDNALIEAVGRAHGKITLATIQVGPRGQQNVLGGEETLGAIGARAGDARYSDDPDGVIRHMVYALTHLESFPVEAAEIARHRRIAPGSLPGGRAWIDYVGSPGTIGTTSFADVFRGRVPPGRFTGKIVVVGVSDPAEQDLHKTPVGDLMSGPEIQANAARTALHGFPLRSTPAWVSLALIIALGLIAPLASLRLGASRVLPLGLALGALFTVGNQVAFDSGRVVSFLYPLGTLILSLLVTMGGHYVLGAAERIRTRDVFSRFVPEQVVDELLAQSAGQALGGVRREVTVLFSDLRGFTTFSESRPPEAVVETLNQYLGEMSEAILAHGGTLVSYMGDGIMAVFGAPIEQPDHADRALAAAREMTSQRLTHFNAWMTADGVGEPFAMGVGLNTGEVMAGNVGSERRLEYTAIGDATNTAARLEGMTKGTPHQVFVAESTRERLSRVPDDLVFVDEMPIRGRRSGIRVWGLMDTETG